jgi:hypothetical protein
MKFLKNERFPFSIDFKAGKMINFYKRRDLYGKTQRPSKSGVYN